MGMAPRQVRPLGPSEVVLCPCSLADPLPGYCHLPFVAHPPADGGLHSLGPMGAGTQGAHGAHRTGLALPAPSNPTALDRGSQPPLAPTEQACRDWAPGPIHPSPTMAVIGGQEAKTTRERVIYQRGQAIRLTKPMEDVMADMRWSVVLPVCKQPNRDLPSDTRIHQLLVSLLDIEAPVEPPLSACKSTRNHAPTTAGRGHGGLHHGMAP